MASLCGLGGLANYNWGGGGAQRSHGLKSGGGGCGGVGVGVGVGEVGGFNIFQIRLYIYFKYSDNFTPWE